VLKSKRKISSRFYELLWFRGIQSGGQVPKFLMNLSSQLEGMLLQPEDGSSGLLRTAGPRHGSVVFSLRRTEFDSRSVYMGFVADKWNLKALFFQYTSVSPASIFPPSIRSYVIIATDSVVASNENRIMSQKTYTLVLTVQRSQNQTSPALQEHFSSFKDMQQTVALRNGKITRSNVQLK
jgi:hypothetical protein